MRLFERALRRAGLPIKMTQGFNPRPRISFPLALALGIEGLEEIVELEFSRWLPPKTILEQLNAQLPDGLDLFSAEVVAPPSPRVEEIAYEVHFPNAHSVSQERVDELLKLKEHWIVRDRAGKKKSIDLRPSILSVIKKDGVLEIKLKVLQDGTARPEEVLEALGLSTPSIQELKITRTKVLLSSQAAA